jgi:glutamate mutase epsilon subunit
VTCQDCAMGGNKIYEVMKSSIPSVTSAWRALPLVKYTLRARARLRVTALGAPIDVKHCDSEAHRPSAIAKR